MTNKITYIFLETHNWGKTVKYWQQIGYEVDLDLGTSGRMVNAAGGPALFITEMPEGHELSTQIAIRTDEAGWQPEPVHLSSPLTQSGKNVRKACMPT